MTLPKRDIPALIEALRIRALALTGEKWERNSTRDMMKEAADRLEEYLSALPPAAAPPMFQLARFDRGSESWRWVRSDWPEHRIIAYETREAAEAAALAYSQSNHDVEVLIVTLHDCIKTETNYPQPEPIVRTRRIPLEFSKPATPTDRSQSEPKA